MDNELEFSFYEVGISGRNRLSISKVVHLFQLKIKPTSRLTYTPTNLLRANRMYLSARSNRLLVDGIKTGFPDTGLDLTTISLIVHGWLYVAYLFGDFRMWTLFRWNFRRFLIIALGGIVPLLSFFTERHFSKVAEKDISAITKKVA